MKNVHETIAAIEATKPRSAWDKGVQMVNDNFTALFEDTGVFALVSLRECSSSPYGKAFFVSFFEIENGEIVERSEGGISWAYDNAVDACAGMFSGFRAHDVNDSAVIEIARDYFGF